MEGAVNLGEFGGRGEILGMDEGEMVTAPALEDVARPTGACFSKCALHFMQILLYKDATNNQNTMNRTHLSIETEYALKSSYSWFFFCA